MSVASVITKQDAGPNGEVGCQKTNRHRLQSNEQHRNCCFRTGRIHLYDWQRLKRSLLRAVSAEPTISPDTWRHVHKSQGVRHEQRTPCHPTDTIYSPFSEALQQKAWRVSPSLQIASSCGTRAANLHHTLSAPGPRSTLLPHSLVSDWSILYLTTMYELHKLLSTARQGAVYKEWSSLRRSGSINGLLYRDT